jgi:hypothetical protein
MADEQLEDECIQEIERAFKVEVVIHGLDVTLEQLKDRFADQDVAFLREIHLFSPAGLTSSKSISNTDVENICSFYGLNSDIIARERNLFVPVYESMEDLIDVDDLSLPVARERLTHDVDRRNEAVNSDDESDESDDEQEATTKLCKTTQSLTRAVLISQLVVLDEDTGNCRGYQL